MSPSLEWSPHPLRRPGWLLAGLLHLAVGVALVLEAWRAGRFLEGTWRGPLLGTFVSAAVAATLFMPAGLRRGPGRIALVLLVALGGLLLHLVLLVRTASPEAGFSFGPVLLVAGVGLTVAAELRRRTVRITLDDRQLAVFVTGYRIEHTLPLTEVRDVAAARSFWGRIWGYGDFVARVRKGTMQEHITKPLVGEEPPESATRGNGWDEEERFRLDAAHPYKRIRRELENRILLAKMPPKEREEAELAHRLAADLERLKA